jgi:hypothetical protein
MGTNQSGTPSEAAPNVERTLRFSRANPGKIDDRWLGRRCCVPERRRL